MAYNLLLLLMTVVVLLYAGPLGGIKFGLCADLKEHTHQFMSLWFVCQSEAAHPSVHVTVVCVSI